MKKIHFLFFSAVLFVACGNSSQKVKTEAKTIVVPGFSADSAYLFVKKQVDFGPRVPNTKAHDECALYLVAELRRHGAVVIEQKADLTAFDGTVLKSTNVIGSFNPKAEVRILLLAHWDSRPWADNDRDPANHKKPVMAANDGASGVGVLLEMARLMGKNLPAVGVDILFVDAEDYGKPSSAGGEPAEDSWCLGTQYWAKSLHTPGYTARYGILLDMVGAPQAVFYREQASDYYAENVVTKVWSQAQSLGFENYFRNEKGGSVTDDHIYVNKITGIPCIDIIHYDPNSRNGFGEHWHTINDTMDNIDKNTLKAVGMTLTQVIYNEAD